MYRPSTAASGSVLQPLGIRSPLRALAVAQTLPADNATKKAINAFADVLKQADREVDPWARLVHHDAPRVLGDTFLASIAALIVDSDWRTARSELDDILCKHVDESLRAMQPTKGAPAVRKTADAIRIGRVPALLNILADGKRRRVFGPMAGACSSSAPPPQLEKTDEQARDRCQLEMALDFTDVHIC